MALLELLLYDDDFLIDDSDEFILYEDASSYNCCCGNTYCCGCQTLQTAYGLNQTLKVRITGAITGYCSLQTLPSAANRCAGWFWDSLSTSCEETIVESCGLNLFQMGLACPTGSTTMDKWQFEASLSNLGCDLTGNVTPIISYAKARTPDSGATCSPLTLEFTFPLVDQVPGGCSTCSASYIKFAIDGPY